MALEPEFSRLLDRIESRLDRQGNDLLDGDDLPQRLRAIIGHLDEVVLPRNIVFALGAELSCTLTVASRRLLRVSVSTPDGNQVIAATAGAGRDEQLVTMAEALAGLAAIDEPLTIARIALADGVAADDVGHAIADIGAFCAEHDWFEGHPADGSETAPGPAVAIGWTRISPAGEILDFGGEAGTALAPEKAAALASEHAAWPQDIAALAGQGAIVLCPGPGGAAALRPEADALQVEVFGPSRLEDLMAALRRREGDGA